MLCLNKSGTFLLEKFGWNNIFEKLLLLFHKTIYFKTSLYYSMTLIEAEDSPLKFFSNYFLFILNFHCLYFKVFSTKDFERKCFFKKY